MSKKPEQRLYDTMKDHAPPEIHLERIENGIVYGTPDVHTISRGKTVWFELKVFEVPKRASTPVVKRDTFEVDQIKWHRVYAHNGGISFCLARDEAMQIFLIPGADISTILQPASGGKAALFTLQALTRFQLVARYGVKDWKTAFERAFRL